MAIDKELYRQTYELYRQWNRAEKVERAHNAGTRPPEEAWQQFLALWEFSWQMKLGPTQTVRARKLAALNEYYIRLQQFEAWRHSRDGTT